MMVIESATDEDLDFLPANDQHVSADMLRRKVDAGEILIARMDGEPVGWLRWGWFWDEIPFMNMLLVLDIARGQGIGSQLVSAWEARMQAAGHSRVMTSTQANETAQHFYRKLGYIDVGALLLPGEPAELLFIKSLNGLR